MSETTPSTAPGTALSTAIADVVAMVNGHGVPAVCDPADLAELPAVLVYPNLLDFDRLNSDSYELTVDLMLVASNVTAPAALAQLDALLSAIRVPLQITEARAVTLSLPNLAPDPLPALQASVTFAITTTPEDTP